jgi:predicted DNA-binding transcriptional regulator
LHKDQFVGAALMTASLIVVIAYVWLVFFPPLTGADIFMLKLTGTVAVAGVFGILSWIGYTLATTPPPKPIEEIEKEIEKELKEIEGEAPSKPEK